MDNEKNVEQTVQKMQTEKKPEGTSSKFNGKIIVPIVAVVATILILLGVYSFYFSNPKRIMTSAITKFSDKLDNVFEMADDSKDLGDSYTITGDVAINAKSDLLATLANNPEYMPYVKMVNNLNKLKNTYTFKQDFKNKKLLFSLESKLGNTNILSTNYIIQDKKQYILVKNFFDTYIDGGELDYFSMLEDGNNSMDDIKYLYDFTVNSFKKNLKNEYFEKETTKTLIGAKEKEVRKISLVVNNKNVNEILGSILEDLKKDKKANKILTGLDENFKDAKINKDQVPVDDGQEIIFAVFTDKLTYQELKYEMVFKDKTSTTNLVYTEGKEDKLEIYSQDKLIGSATILEKDKTTTINLKDAKDTKIGTIEFVNDKLEKTLKATISYQGIDGTLSFDSKMKKKDNGYDINNAIKLMVRSNGATLLDVSIDDKGEATKGAEVTETVGKSIKIDNITEQQSKKAETELYRVIMALMQ